MTSGNDPVRTGFDKVVLHAEERLQIKKGVALEDYLDVFKKFLKLEDHRLAMQHRYYREGFRTCKQRSRMVDLLLQRMYTIVMDEYSRTHPQDASRCALVALGGYGRGELNFHSDIDLMFLFPDKTGALGKFLVNKILYLLWDLGLTVGHSTRTITEALGIGTEDLTSRTALLEGRFLAGDSSIFRHLADKLDSRFAGSQKTIQSYIVQKLSEREQRHTKFGASMYLQEPNVKESIGGIRDLHNVLWILRLKYGSLDLRLAESHHLLTTREVRSLRNSYDFLLAVRNELHLAANKKMDILTRPYQPRVSKAFGYRDQRGRTAAEIFMREYYLHVRTVGFLTESVLMKLKEPLTWFGRKLQIFNRKTIEHELTLQEDTITLDGDKIRYLKEDPLLMLRIFLVSQNQGAKIHEDLKGILRNHLYSIDKGFQNSPQAAKIFRSILARPGHVGSILRTMHEIGFLGKYIPEFGKVTCQVQDSDYHRYTTDEHSLKAIENVDRLFQSPDASPHPNIRRAASEISRPDLLYLALILHDVGKGDHEDHVSLSVFNAERCLKRMRYSPEETEMVLFLIREHLSMNHIAQRRDLEDSTTLLDFSVLVKTPNNLNALMVLSYADASAVAPGIWSHWKEALVVELHQKTHAWLHGRAPAQQNTPQLLQEAKQSLNKVLEGIVPLEAIGKHLDTMPPTYPIFTPAASIAEHILMVENLGDKSFSLDWNLSHGNETLMEVTLCTKDRLGIFAMLAGCFTLHDVNIVGAQVNTRSDGVVLDTFRLSNTSMESLPIKPKTIEGFKNSLERVLRGDLNLDEAIERHERKNGVRSITHKIAPSILLDNRVSESKTVLEIQAVDRLGLLFHIANVLSALALNISAAKISTERALAHDVFYITDRRGSKITEKTTQEKIIKTLLHELEG